ncbi:MAG: hypothetical protein AB2L26_13280 [Ignavibacteria bacterium]
MGDTDILWKPLLDAAAQTLIGALGSMAFAKLVANIRKNHTFDGPMDLWYRGIHNNTIKEDETLIYDGIISPYTQLFPGDPFKNAKRWNQLYSFEGKISKYEYQAMEFFAGSDAALRVGSFNGETLVGLYARYGFIGEGIIGVAPTALIKKKIPQFFESAFYGTRAIIKGTLSRCPSQLGYVAETITVKSGINFGIRNLKNLWYLKIKDIDLYKKDKDRTISLLGSSWAVTERKNQQYLTQYGHFSDQTELSNCIESIQESIAWKYAQVYYDDINCPSPELSFKYKYML